MAKKLKLKVKAKEEPKAEPKKRGRKPKAVVAEEEPEVKHVISVRGDKEEKPAKTRGGRRKGSGRRKRKGGALTGFAEVVS